jgi:hypothetical protein
MKKTIYVSLMAMLTLFGCTKSVNDVKSDSDLFSQQGTNQNSSSDERSYSHWFTSWYYTPLICDGVETDFLFGQLNTHCIMFYENGAIAWMIMNFSGSITSRNTGEVFSIYESDRYDLPEQGIITFHSSINGDQGSHIIMSGSLNTQTWELIIDRTVCQP